MSTTLVHPRVKIRIVMIKPTAVPATVPDIMAMAALS
jgi:hypothetical protein